MTPVKRLPAICLLVLCAIFIGCADQTADSGVSFEVTMLEGLWEDLSEDGSKIEQWRSVGPNHLTGTGFVLAGKDTTFIEKLEIKVVDDTLRYFARIPGQTEQYAVVFTLKTQTDNALVFENDAYQFPQRIAYEMNSQVEMKSFIEGRDNGEFRKVESWYMRKN